MSLENTDFPVRMPLRMDWSEMDLYDHINNVMILKYVQTARVHYWDTVGIKTVPRQDHGPILASTSCRFLRPLVYPGELQLLSRLSSLGNSSFGLQHRILDQHGQIAVEAHDLIVMYDYNSNKKIRVNDEIRTAMERLEGRLPG
ncbi:MAG: thioesterase family protein [Bacteroidetes bacterium]|nr:thioesterase family protein [Bacteroidota bacterium]